MTIKYLKLFLLFDAALIALLYFLASSLTVLNSQVAVLSSLLILFASFNSYQKMISKRAQDFEGMEFEDEDLKNEDPHGLWEEDDLENEKDAAMLYKEERARSKRTPVIKNTISTAGALFAPFRVLSYGFLLFGFFMLLEYEIFEPIGYLVGFMVMPLSATLFAFLNRKQS